MVPFNVLFIDSYDSFTFNVVRLIEKQLVNGDEPVHVTTIRNDTFTDMKQLAAEVGYFDCVIVGPGPGNPVNGFGDVGIVSCLFSGDELIEVPVLGICLGFQAMCHSQGSSIDELKTIKHGQVYPIELLSETRTGIFDGYPAAFKSVRYHSLHVSKASPAVIPLATTDDENGSLLMAAQIKQRPWYGVQYHPESCCSELGDRLIKNFLELAHAENLRTGRYQRKKELYMKDAVQFSRKLAELDGTIDHSSIFRKFKPAEKKEVSIRKYNASKVPELTLKLSDSIPDAKFIMASSKVADHRGEWSIIALPNERSVVLTHYSQVNRTTVHRWRDPKVTQELINSALRGENNEADFPESFQVLREDKSHFWITMGEFMTDKLVSNHKEIPFIGGLVGTLGYEMGYYVYNTVPADERLIPDAKLVYIENCIVIDHTSGQLYCISLCDQFPTQITQMLDECEWLNDDQQCRDLPWSDQLPSDVSFDIQMPNKDDYAAAFRRSQEYMHRGDSYELCLTTQTNVVPSRRIAPWRVFQTLVRRNPAPFSSFFEFSDVLGSDSTLCLLSTSPERFLKWDADTCELRPIKGTVKKTADMTRDKALAILRTPKEFGENLMILDLIRNDLFELLPNVAVREFMAVEEYHTVYQLVSVVAARGLASPLLPYTGLDVLRHSLPPGSMTGAPKKSSVELLQLHLEPALSPALAGSRGLYSGVTGYWSANGNGDWSVNIRCIHSYNGGACWHIGAGGALTVLSSLDGELQEMYTKLQSALQVFL
ncbi:hypothetical protein HG536_0A09170 [Torulaspora globosa]|uniref:aminodeoxychorismate synthase n=1 Tax=Torulaspora globosa TaxID=48254 RepID=A0A7G3ZC64_9SACH|nr:uncharacterized protein HG536_0A09170 [Torulaspora globosa]QLL31100.1 hypothetical protein HG536_0A09170 [Torulaspora globosa]